MGYQVGNVCYATKQDADNVYFSLVAPVVSTTTTTGSIFRPSTTTSQLIAPSYKNGKWYLQNQVITANLPNCNSAENFKNGLELGWLIFGVMSVCYVFIIVKRLLR